MEDKLLCPLLPISPLTGKPDPCIKENCAWWNKEAGCCAIVSIAINKPKGR